MTSRRDILYDPEADILVRIREGKAVDSEWLDNDIVLLYDENGELLEIEVHHARKRGLVEILRTLAKHLGATPTTQ